MAVSGHRTTSTWLRYRITDDDEVRKALAQTQAAVRAQQDRASNVLELRRAAEGPKG